MVGVGVFTNIKASIDFCAINSALKFLGSRGAAFHWVARYTLGSPNDIITGRVAADAEEEKC